MQLPKPIRVIMIEPQSFTNKNPKFE